MSTVYIPKRPDPADLYLQRDAADLARIRYGMTLTEICCRDCARERAWVAAVLLQRGWRASHVARTLGYQHSGTMQRGVELLAMGRWMA